MHPQGPHRHAAGARGHAEAEARRTEPLAPGERLGGRFLLERRVGAGGMGEVYRARDLELDEIVAVKVMLPGRIGDASAAATLRREVRAARSIASPYVARTFELHHAGALTFLVMEFIEGHCLSTTILAGHRPGPDRAVVIARDVLLGLSAAHAAGVIHRDVKPANIMIRPSGQAILTDFGIARLAQQQHATGGLSGTPAYMAPEQLQGGLVGPAADVFSLGVVLYELLAGTLPWLGSTPMATAIARLSEPPVPLGQRTANLPPSIEGWVMRALDRDPARRWPTAQAAADALAIAAGQHAQTGFSFGLNPLRQSPGRGALALNPLLDPGLVDTRVSQAGEQDQSVADQTGKQPVGPNNSRPWRDMDATADSQAEQWVNAGANSRPAMGSDLPRLAILPFRVQQPVPAELQAVSGLDDDLVTGLSGYRGLRVLSPGAVARLADAGTAWQALAAALGASHVVEGAVRSTGTGVRINVRLLAVADEQVLWNQRVDVGRDGLLAAGDELAAAIAQTLGAAESAQERPQVGGSDGAALYLSARANLHSDEPARVGVAVALLQRAVKGAPGDRVLHGMLAWAMVRQWLLGDGRGSEQLMQARQLVSSLVGQSDLPAEACLASGLIALALGDPIGGVRWLRHAITRSPSLAPAHELIGIVLLQADRPADGFARLQSAEQLAPDLLRTRLARCFGYALSGDWESHDTLLDQLRATPSPDATRIALYRWRLREALWRRDRARLQTLATELTEVGGINADAPELVLLTDWLATALGQQPLSALVIPAGNLCASSLIEQMIVDAELAAFLGDDHRAFWSVAAAVGLGAANTAWLRHCPLLDSMRDGPGWQTLLERLTRRSEAILGAARGEMTV